MSKKQTKIKYLDLWGLRKEKYKFLESHNVKNTKWQDLELKEPHYWFVPKDFNMEEKYKSFISVKNIFTNGGKGVITSRDKFVISMNKNEAERKIRIFIDKGFSNEMVSASLSIKNTGTWSIDNARERIIKKGFDDKKIIKYNYRLFDERLIYFDDVLIERSRKEVMNNFLEKDNIALVTTKLLAEQKFYHSFITDQVSDACLISLKTKEGAYIFPLYLYSDKKSVFKGQKHLDIAGVQKQLDENGGKKSNIKQEFVQELFSVYEKQISVESIFYYIYGVLYSNIYRKKYNEFLKIDFPKIPFTKNYDLFCEISEIGKELVNLHLLKSPKLDKVIAKFPVSTGNILTDGQVKKREYNAKEKRIYINDEQYFEGVEPEVWDYYIGGYQVLDKWLKDRIGEKLSLEDVNHYLKVIIVIKRTIDLQKEIDKIYPKIEKSLINFNKNEKDRRLRIPN